MSYSRYRDDAYDDAYWERSMSRLAKSKDGFAWGAFFIGLIVGGILL